MAKFDGYKLIKNRSGVKQSKAIEFVWYEDSTPIDDMIDWIGSASCIRGWWTAYHDKDLREDGTPKKHHFHTVCWLTQEKDEIEAARWLTRTGCPAMKSVRESGVNSFDLWTDIRDAVRYLLHLDCVDKSKPRYDSLVPMAGLSSDDGSKWLKTPLYGSKADSVTRDKEASRKVKGILVLLDLIHEREIFTFTELIDICRDDAMLIRAIRENCYLLRQLLQEAQDCTIKYSKNPINGTIEKD